MAHIPFFDKSLVHRYLAINVIDLALACRITSAIRTKLRPRFAQRQNIQMKGLLSTVMKICHASISLFEQKNKDQLAS